MTDNNAIANLADAAADKIDEVGWQQGRMWGTFGQINENADLPYSKADCKNVCAMGAIAICLGIEETGVANSSNTVLDHPIDNAFVTVHGHPMMSVNDSITATQEIVTSALRDVAKKYRSDEFRSAS